MINAYQDGILSKATFGAHKKHTCVCDECGEKVIARCGNLVVHHWAHEVASNCTKHDNEGEWHLGWKNLFNSDEIEVGGVFEGHRADVCLDLSTAHHVLEIQHSPISADDIWDRESAYKFDKMTWLVDVRGRPGFEYWGKDGKYKFNWKHASKSWSNSKANVLFDTGSCFLYWHRIYWFKRGERWGCLPANYIDGNRHATRFDYPTNREEMITILKECMKLRDKDINLINESMYADQLEEEERIRRHQAAEELNRKKQEEDKKYWQSVNDRIKADKEEAERQRIETLIKNSELTRLPINKITKRHIDKEWQLYYARQAMLKRARKLNNEFIMEESNYEETNTRRLY